MSTKWQFQSVTNRFSSRQFMGWEPVILGLVVLLLPTFIGLYNGVWQNEQAHGPIVLAVILYLVWQKREIFSKHFPSAPTKTGTQVGGWLIFVLGLLVYILGSSQNILSLEVGALIFILSGILLLTLGVSALASLWFPLFFILFMMPLPAFIIDAITLPMKIAVSIVAENVLYWLGYPIARSGVILQIGQYQLLVADACAGMHTLISLEALGLLYLNLVKHDSVMRNITLALLIIPISFTANVIRVMTLTLITYYFGNEVGQGFVHGFAGLLLFVVALVLIMTVDAFLQKLSKKIEKES